jgi:hypothetical protein
MLLKYIRKWWATVATNSNLESFIIGCDPQSIAEIEQLTREYHYRTAKGTV